MFRKLSLAVVAAASLGAVALAPTAASAQWHGGGWHHGRAWGTPHVYRGYAYRGHGGCYVRRLVPTPWGPRWRLVNRCS